MSAKTPRNCTPPGFQKHACTYSRKLMQPTSPRVLRICTLLVFRLIPAGHPRLLVSEDSHLISVSNALYVIASEHLCPAKNKRPASRNPFQVAAGRHQSSVSAVSWLGWLATACADYSGGKSAPGSDRVLIYAEVLRPRKQVFVFLCQNYSKTAVSSQRHPPPP